MCSWMRSVHLPPPVVGHIIGLADDDFVGTANVDEGRIDIGNFHFKHFMERNYQKSLKVLLRACDKRISD